MVSPHSADSSVKLKSMVHTTGKTQGGGVELALAPAQLIRIVEVGHISSWPTIDRLVSWLSTDAHRQLEGSKLFPQHVQPNSNDDRRKDIAHNSFLLTEPVSEHDTQPSAYHSSYYVFSSNPPIN